MRRPVSERDAIKKDWPRSRWLDPGERLDAAARREPLGAGLDAGERVDATAAALAAALDAGSGDAGRAVRGGTGARCSYW